jgi:hypothetical protein
MTYVRTQRTADLAFTVVLLVIFVGALVLARQWGFRASFVPTLVASAGAALSALHLVLLLIGRRRAAAPAADPEPDEHDPAQIFATTSATLWRSSLAWLAGFFVAVGVVGLIAATVTFVVAYLRLSVKASWRFSAIYAAAVGLVLWLVFGEVLAIQIPEGVFG